MISRAPFAPQRRLACVLFIALAATLAPVGCRQYDVQGSKVRGYVPRDTSEASARMRVDPGLRSGLSSTAQDIERSVGY